MSPLVMRPISIIALYGAFAICGCHKSSSVAPDPPEACGGVSLPAIVVHVFDGVTGVAAASGADVIVRDGSYADSVHVGASAPLDSAGIALAYDRLGTYDVVVRKAGYVNWTRPGVSVGGEPSPCTRQVKTVSVNAILARAP